MIIKFALCALLTLVCSISFSANSCSAFLGENLTQHLAANALLKRLPTNFWMLLGQKPSDIQLYGKEWQKQMLDNRLVTMYRAVDVWAFKELDLLWNFRPERQKEGNRDWVADHESDAYRYGRFMITYRIPPQLLTPIDYIRLRGYPGSESNFHIYLSTLREYGITHTAYFVDDISYRKPGSTIYIPISKRAIKSLIDRTLVEAEELK